MTGGGQIRPSRDVRGMSVIPPKAAVNADIFARPVRATCGLVHRSKKNHSITLSDTRHKGLALSCSGTASWEKSVADSEDHWAFEVIWPRRWTEDGVRGKMHLDAAKNGRPREQAHGGRNEKADTRHNRRRKRRDGAHIDGRGRGCTGAGTAVRPDQGYRSRLQLSVWDSPCHGRGDK